jgi:hypothetical protein
VLIVARATLAGAAEGQFTAKPDDSHLFNELLRRRPLIMTMKGMGSLGLIWREIGSSIRLRGGAIMGNG